MGSRPGHGVTRSRGRPRGAPNGEAGKLARARMVERKFDPLDELISLLSNKRKVAELTTYEHGRLLLQCMAYAYPKLRQVEHQIDTGPGELIIELGGLDSAVGRRD